MPAHCLRLGGDEEEAMCLTADIFQLRVEHHNMIIISITINSLSKYPFGCEAVPGKPHRSHRRSI